MIPNIPQHIAIVMDGNGRWAKQRNLPRIAGHKVGIDSVRTIVQLCSDKGVKVLTLFAFSTENWSRPSTEVGFLMHMFVSVLGMEVKKLHKKNVRMRFIGERHTLDKKLQTSINKAEALTANNTGLTLVIALNYSGRWDITTAVRNLTGDIVDGKLTAAMITTDILHKYICLSDLPEPDLFIRTSGELRISNFLLWQLAYTELYFTDVLWPDFREKELDAAFAAFTRRDRRFGKVEETTIC